MVVEADWRVEETQENSSCELLSQDIYHHASVLVGGKVIVHGGHSMGVGWLETLYTLDLATKSWQNIPVTTSSRPYHAIVLVDDKIYIHGGRNGKKMERLDIVTLETEEIVERCVGLSVGLTRCWAHTLEFYEQNGVLLTFGGEVKNGIVNEDVVLTYHVDSGIWERLNAKGVKPLNRRKHASCMVGDCMYLYGGQTIGEVPNHFLNDLAVLTMRPSPSWSTVVEHEGLGRFGASLSHIGGRLVVYGGLSHFSHSPVVRKTSVVLPAVVLAFNILSKTPSIQSEEALNNASATRMHHSAIVHGDEILIFGGVNLSNSSSPLRSVCRLSLSW